MNRFRALQMSLACFAMLFLLPGDGGAFTEEELLGTWFVLIHYRNSETANPDADRWEDKIWTFEKRGSRLQWTEYPIVVFGDQTGRFERYRGVRSRVLAAWQPNSAQQAQIDGGLEINSRGSKSKSLRGTLVKGYKSTGRLRTQSASIIGYMENWSITGGPDKPVFARDDMMGSGRTENMEGRTEYATQEILDGGRLLRGLYERDGIRKGTFQMMRAGDVTRVAGKSEKVQEERRQLFMDAAQGPGGLLGSDADRKGEALKQIPEQGIGLKEALVRAGKPPRREGARVRARDIQIYRLGEDGPQPMDRNAVESDSLAASSEQDYGILVRWTCSGPGANIQHVAWYLLPGNAMAAWDHVTFYERCTPIPNYQPATGSQVTGERQLTVRTDEEFPKRQELDVHLYAKGVQLVAVGRVEDAQAMLARGDAAGRLLSGIEVEGMPSVADREAARKRLADAIAKAKPQASTSDATAEK